MSRKIVKSLLFAMAVGVSTLAFEGSASAQRWRGRGNYAAPVTRYYNSTLRYGTARTYNYSNGYYNNGYNSNNVYSNGVYGNSAYSNVPYRSSYYGSSYYGNGYYDNGYGNGFNNFGSFQQAQGANTGANIGGAIGGFRGANVGAAIGAAVNSGR